MIWLGLIGDNIAASSAPRLHETAGRLVGLDVRYDRLVPKDFGLGFEAVFNQAQRNGRRGLNITYPYKERACALVKVTSPDLAALGAVNTVIFGTSGPTGWNTDYTGFMAAYHAARSDPPGRVGVIGCGGVGRAIAFGLARLEAEDVVLFDHDPQKAQALASDVSQALSAQVHVAPSIGDLVTRSDALINATPVGMVGYGGCPVPDDAFVGKSWAFDAVYTPEDTPFLNAAHAAGAQVISGWDLFFWQGVHAFSLFTDHDVAPDALRKALRGAG